MKKSVSWHAVGNLEKQKAMDGMDFVDAMDSLILLGGAGRLALSLVLR